MIKALISPQQDYMFDAYASYFGQAYKVDVVKLNLGGYIVALSRVAPGCHYVDAIVHHASVTEALANLLDLVMDWLESCQWENPIKRLNGRPEGID